ncbi:hypothetical protein GOP47_0009499 [Adiantum capillus-veneris]|uniref:Condensin complex subunit 1 C-terminal domain-containing protein n=1 Tax=Adiantum capillus-veneris TaxID=13818 RepID=A0A9D4UXL8_ADICA|nr:hypothetical protein GOP47_0009499 [Adiantum capillus-veneris]
MEDEESSLSRAFSVFALAARSCPSGRDGMPSTEASSLPEETLIELHDVFGAIGKSQCASQRLKDNTWNPGCSNAGFQTSVVSGAEMWEELARQDISLASVIQGLIGSMETGGKLGILSADVYLGFMLAPGCPLYSLFSQVAFNSLLRCMRHACKASATPEQDGSASGAGTGKTKGKGRGGKRKGKNGSDKSLESQESGYDDDCFLPEAQKNHPVSPQAALDDVLHLLKRLQGTLRVFHFKDHQESLKSLIEFLIELPHLVSEMQIADAGGESRAKRTAQHHVSSPLLTTCSLCLDILKNLLDPSHGNPMDTAVISFKLLAPSILLTRAGGNPYQQGQIREQTLSFITIQLKRQPNPGLRSVIGALPRYLAMKAPEKTEPRALAVESVLAIVKILAVPDQRKFGRFVAKLSRGKPRHRLFAVDLAQSLLVPDPLGLDKEEDCPDEEFFSEEENVPMEEETVQIEDGNKGRNSVHTPSPEACGSPDTKIWWGTACLEALLHRCSDKIPAIRARALNNLAQVLEKLSSDIRNRAVLQSLLGFGTMAPPRNKEAESSLRKAALLNDWHTPGHSSPNLGGQTPSPEPSLVGPGASPLTPGAGHGDLGSLLRRRCFDDKVAVRKATLLLMTKSASLLGRPPDETMLEAMGSACADPMVSIRKAAMGALSEVMRKFPADTKVVGEWYQSVMPLVLDNESSIHEECLNVFEELVVDRVAAVASSKFLGGGILNSLHMDRTILKLSSEQELEKRMPPGVLVVLKGMAEDSAVAACIKRVVTCLGKKKKLRAGIALALQNIITSSRTLWCSCNKEGTSSQTCWTAPAGAWLLLAEVSAFVPKAVGWEFLRTHWQLLEREESMPVPGGLPSGKKVNSVVHFADWAADRVHLLQAISNVAVELPPDAAADLAAELLERLEGFSMDPTEVGAHVKALHVLCIHKANSADEGDRLVTIWVEELLEKAGLVVTSYLSACANSEPTEIHLSLRTSKSGGSKDGADSCERHINKGRSTSTGVKTSNQIIPAIFTIGALVLISPKLNFGNLATSLQAIISSRKAGLKLYNQNESCVSEDLARGVVAQAWVTLGKMCLANHELAKRCIPLFLQEFEQSESAPVRNNIMIAMSDFCVRYTSLIDGYIHKLTKSLRDSCELVRRQGFVLLAQLLQRDYVKWRGTLFHRFLLALVDDSEKIRQLANFLFSSILKTKAPLLAYNSFVETIFVLNDCHAHAGHIDILHVTESERELFSLRGNSYSKIEMRMHIYKCLLKQMAPEHVLATSAKLCADILAAAADGMLNLEDPTAQCVLEDSLKILASKEMRIGGNRGAAAAENFEREEDGAAAFAAAKGRVVSQLAKRNLVQNAIPIFIELKRLLESKNSPLTGMLMECMRVMLKEYKNEIEEILVADKQLQKEIMYDMQKHEAAKAKAKVVAAATAVLSPGSAGLRQRDGNTAVPPRSLLKKTPSAEKSRRVADGKENMVASKGKSIADGQSVEQGPAKASTGLLSKRKTFLSPETSSRVRWLDQTPDLSSHAAHIPRSLSRGAAPVVGISTPVNGLRPAYDGETSSAPVEGSFADRLQKVQSNMASAVANVVAEATAAAVLSEVARGTPTGPLQAMSIPRLQATVPSTVKKATFLNSCEEQEDVPANGLLSHEDEAMASLESVRRRQSFSSIDVPGSSS